MLLYLNYEEIQALRAGAHACLDRDTGMGERATVLAPSMRRAAVEALLPRFDGDLSVATLDELREVLMGITAIVERLRAEMQAVVLEAHPAHEGAVAAYFDFAHALVVQARARDMVAEMEALLELVTEGAVTQEAARSFEFPD